MATTPLKTCIGHHSRISREVQLGMSVRIRIGVHLPVVQAPVKVAVHAIYQTIHIRPN